MHKRIVGDAPAATEIIRGRKRRADEKQTGRLYRTPFGSAAAAQGASMAAAPP
ncbi:hypothetical protein AB3662_43890 [Sorangium cellulosum]|uniref:hypothetical protein n=1 Tax=Sorangium cellulosum TaxID=56 RepID=UPI003D9A334F